MMTEKQSKPPIGDELNRPKSSDDTAEFTPSNPPAMSPQTVDDALRPLIDQQLNKPEPMGKRVMRPMTGFVWNPLLKLPRNEACPCRSGKKFKACCLRRLPPVIPEKLASLYREQMLKPELIFITKQNEAALQTLAPEGLGKTTCKHGTPTEHPCVICQYDR